ncbi:hypothetical protein [Sphingomonas corticis]|jgi:hypothetical protein|uniref:STAS/SEC14 domain-containing protein n=1 Tax=Sphingomonas corticis TaxID=2722791 RepID=A0ABX1CNP6_9SPHN|nr:hypothetical protein [Sphingomonas corticis]NJR78288.1 hypothetical protein [Sphingomonas corticis]
MYKIAYIDATRTLEITTWGFWTVATIAAFSAEAVAKFTALRLRHGPVAVLADMRQAPIQTNEVIGGVEALMRKAVRLTSFPIAAVAGSMLGKLQSERVLTAPNCRTFLDIDEARAWIDAHMPASRRVA